MHGAEGSEQCNENELIPAPPQKDKNGSRNHYLPDHRKHMPRDGSFLAGGNHANLDRTRIETDQSTIVIRARVEFDAEPAQPVADERAHFGGVLSNAAGE